jgi:hypothetical protein
MNNMKPAILIYVDTADSDMLYADETPAGFLAALTEGIEEEGVPYEIRRLNGEADGRENAHMLFAYRAAEDSALGVGVGVAGGRGALSARGVPPGCGLFDGQPPGLIGRNAARAVKRRRFLFRNNDS